MRVLVIGATGVLGRPVVKALRRRGVEVRAACRHPEQAADLAALGVEVVAADLTDSASLQRACQGTDRLLMAAHSILGRGRWRSEAVDDAGARTLIERARDAGVQRFVYCSGMGVRTDHPVDFFATKARIEQVLKASDMPHVILRPSAFMEQHVHLFNGRNVLLKGKAQLVGAGSKPRNFVAAGDVALLAERALLDDPLPFTLLEIGGPDHASNAEVAASYASAAGIRLKVSHLPAGVARVLSMLAAPLHPGVARLLRILSLPADAFDEHFDGATELEARFGLRLTRLQDFVSAEVQAWRAQPGPRALSS